MRATSIVSHLVALGMLSASACVFAQNSDSSWENTYPVSGKPTLELRSDDAALDVHACSGCRAVRIHVLTKNVSLATYTITETQSGDRVQFELKQKPHSGFHTSWGAGPRWVRVEVETPAELTLRSHTADGSIALHGLSGDLDSSTSDGSQSLEDVSGTVKLHSSDGGLTIRQTSGTLDASTADGSINATGVLSGVKLHSSDGSIQLHLAEGSRLTQPADISAADGSVSVQLPHAFPSDLNIATSDGSVRADVELASNGSDERGRNHVAGKLDGGGPAFTIRSSDGSVHVSR